MVLVWETQLLGEHTTAQKVAYHIEVTSQRKLKFQVESTLVSILSHFVMDDMLYVGLTEERGEVQWAMPSFLKHALPHRIMNLCKINMKSNGYKKKIIFVIFAIIISF